MCKVPKVGNKLGLTLRKQKSQCGWNRAAGEKVVGDEPGGMVRVQITWGLMRHAKEFA